MTYAAPGASSGTKRLAVACAMVLVAFDAYALETGVTPTNAQRAAATPWIWPLCGRLGEAPGGWSPGQACPRSAAELAESNGDLPVHNGYGPRTFTDETRPYSFHRGFDFATRDSTLAAGLPGNPVFAVCDGWISDFYGSDPDATVLLKCPRDGTSASPASESPCATTNPCVTAAYRHLQQVRVAAGGAVTRGQHLGYSGSAASTNFAFPHLHFEVLDPSYRPSSRDGGRVAFSKDSANPLRYLPRASSAGAEFPVVVELARGYFDSYASASGVVGLRVAARPGYAMDFDRIEVAVYRPSEDGTHWREVPKSASAIVAETGTSMLEEQDPVLGLPYAIADGRLDVSRWDPESFSQRYSPFGDGSTLWGFERNMTYYRLLGGGAHPGLDGLMELNARGRMTNGHLVFDMDFKLIEPFPNPDVALETWTHDWWGMYLGFRGYPELDAIPLCVDATVRLVSGLNNPIRERRFLVSDSDSLPCDASRLGSRLFGNGFELDSP
jgi:murein DD-endopeptidase MepM/ murein hydrolase activator NlpD